MREIKFKYTVIRENGHIFSEIFTLADIENGMMNRWYAANHVGPDQLKRNQYIGRKDKNGNEIYERHILKEETSGMYKEGQFIPHYSIGFIDWASPFDGYMRYRDLQKQHSWVNEIHSENTEIIGDTYSNPELLE